MLAIPSISLANLARIRDKISSFLNSRNNICGFFRFLLTDRILIFQLLHFLLLELFRLFLLILRIQKKPTRHDQTGNDQHYDRFFIKFHFFFSFISFGGTGS